MNDNPSPFQIHADEVLEARITAYVLGESSPFESAELEDLISKSPELQLFLNRTRTLHTLLKEAETTSNTPSEDWKLPAEKREKLDAILGSENIVRLNKESRIRRASFRAVIGIAAVFVLTLFTIRLVPWDYEAEAIIEVKPRVRVMNPLSGMMGSNNSKMTPTFFGTEFEKIKSRNTLGQVIDELDLTTKWGIDREAALNRLKGNVETTNIRGTDLLSIRVSEKNEQDALDITDSLVRNYTEYRTALEDKNLDNGINELKKAVREQEDKVEERRKVLTTISRTKDIVYAGDGTRRSLDVDRSANSSLDEYTRLENEKMQLESQIQSLLSYDSEQLMIYSSGLDLPDNVVRTLYPQYLAQKREVEGLKANGLAEKHPTVLSQERILETTKEQLNEGVVNLRTRLQGQLDLAKDRLSMAEVKKDEAKKNAVEENIDAQDYHDAERDFETEKGLLEQMKLKLISAEIDGDITEESIVVHDPATIKRRSVLPWLSAPEKKEAAEVPVSLAAASEPSGGGFQPPSQASESESTPEEPQAELAELLTGGLRSGDAAITSDSIDALLNNPDRTAGVKVEEQIIGLTGLLSPEVTDKKKQSELSASEFDAFAPDAPKPSDSDPGVQRKPTAPASSLLPEIVTRSDSGPVSPEIVALNEKPSFGDADDFGDGWGEGKAGEGSDYSGLAKREMLRRQSAVSEAETNNKLKEELGYLDDSVRTNPALTGEHNEKVDQVRRNLYTAEGNYELGKYDAAKENYEAILRVDPYNSAARRGMEKVANAKSDYYRAAYDHTRSELLMQVDSSWELAVPSEEGNADFSPQPEELSKTPVIENESYDDARQRLLEKVDEAWALSVPKNAPEVLEFEGFTNYGDGIAGNPDPASLIDPDLYAPGQKFKLSLRAGSERVFDSGLSPSAGGGEEFRFAWSGVNDDSTTNSPKFEVVREFIYPTEFEAPELPNNVDGETTTFPVTPATPNFSESDKSPILGEIPLLGRLFGESELKPEEGESLARLDIDSEVHVGYDTKYYFRGLDLGEDAPSIPGVESNEDEEFDVAAAEVKLRELKARIEDPAINDSNKQEHFNQWKKLQTELVKRNKPQPKIDLADLSQESPASEDPFSTFSLNISDASFQLARAALAKGERPDPDSIKPEQFYNAVDYGDPAPTSLDPVAAAIDQTAHPVIPGRNLVRIALRTAATGRSEAQPLRLTLLVDQSGSMVREDRRAAMETALEQLATLLTENDEVTVIGFSRTPRLLADSLPGSQARELPNLINQTASEGGTNLDQAITLASELALRHKLDGAQNRIVLFTDGAANLGNADPERLSEKIESLRQQSIAFDIAGIGTTDLNDNLLSELARHGNGRYYLVGENTSSTFAKQLAGAFRPAAENVKVQVKLNPDRVGNFKLIGFEKDRLKTEDFRNDSVDAAELAAEEAGVAMYQIETLPEGSGEIGEVSVRFRQTSTGSMVERTWTIPYDPAAPSLDQANPKTQLATLALLVAQKLQGGPLADAINLKDHAPTIATLKKLYASDPKTQELLSLVEALK
ncbi:MAG: von Willebrand factor type A domain-containing protein [Akkermansiaceae bacterium]|nr:von Willebrand factor type A domain-containing protein [Akkermansiaceae bacterium]MDP4721525.1 von Willebrand factor type A domain-containing protein [Akkermansiaceae bacterium]